MAEDLLAYGVLAQAGLLPAEEYRKKLDALFEADMGNELLLELEFCGKDVQRSVNMIREYVLANEGGFDAEAFGRILLGMLERIYRDWPGTLERFGSAAYLLWEALPGPIAGQEPFSRLCWADDPISYGDEAGGRAIYEELFSYYGDGG